MYYVEFKRTKFLIVSIILLFFISAFSFSVNAEEELVLLPDEEQTVSDYSDEERVDVFAPKVKKRSNIVRRTIKTKKDPALQDNAFVSGNNNPTFNGFVTTILLVIFALFSFLVLTKFFLSREQFNKPGSLLDELAQKFTGGLSSSNGLKLIQTLILTPGQSLYLIEIDGRRILVGGTQQGGVQFVSDLSHGSLNTDKLDFKQIEDYKISANNSKDIACINGVSSGARENKLLKQVEANANPFNSQETSLDEHLPDEIKQNVINNNSISRQTFKRRTNFRKSLLSESGNGVEELLRNRQ